MTIIHPISVQTLRRLLPLFLLLFAAACAQGPARSTADAPSAEQPRAERREATPPETRRPEAERRVVTPRQGPGGVYRVIGVGDVMLGSNHPDERLDARLSEGVDPASVIGPDLAARLRAGDVVFGNLEGTIHDLPGPSKECRNPRVCYVFRSPPFYADILARLGFNVMSLANNHAGDFLEAGRNATAANLDRVGIVYGGVATPGMESGVLRLDDGTRVGFIAFAPNRGTLSLNQTDAAAARVRALSAQTDFTIVSFHGGAEGGEAATVVPRQTEMFLGENRGDVYRFAHTMVDAGADVVFGHGPHVPRAIEVYNRRFIAYSLGNFWTYGRFNLQGLRGLAPIADLQVSRNGELLSLRLHSAVQVGRGTPRLDPQNRALGAIRDLTARDIPEAGLTFHPDGTVTGPGIGPEA